MAKKNEELGYAGAIAEIEDILGRLEGGECDVDTLAAEVKRAAELIALCRERLRKAEADVAGILKEE